MSSLVAKIGGLMMRGGVVLPRHYIEQYQESWDLREILRGGNVDCVLDVGANIGQFAERLRLIGFKGAIVSFEPVPRCFEVLRRRRDRNFWCYQLALGAQNGIADFNVDDKYDVLSSLLKRVHPLRHVAVQPVEVRRLDGLLDEIVKKTGAKNLFLKLDTQGFDLEVVRGCGERIRNFHGLMSEVSVEPMYEGMPHYTEALRTYESFGFTLKSLHVVSRNRRGSVIEYNAMMER